MRQMKIAAAGLCLCAGSVFADQVTLKNGDHLTGTIAKSDGKMETLLIKTEFAGEVTVKWNAITSIVAEEPLHITLKDGQTIAGTVTTSDGALDVATKTAGEVKTSKENVAIVRNDAEQAAHDEEVYCQEHPKFAYYWSGLVDTGLSLTDGNSSTINYTLTAKTVRVTKRDKISMYATAVYAVSPTETTAHEIRGGARGEISFDERLFAFLFTDFGYNELQHLDPQNVAGAGAGYHAVKNARTKLDLSPGGSYNQELFGAYTLATPLRRRVFPQPQRKTAKSLLANRSIPNSANARAKPELFYFSRLRPSGRLQLCIPFHSFHEIEQLARLAGDLQRQLHQQSTDRAERE